MSSPPPKKARKLSSSQLPDDTDDEPVTAVEQEDSDSFLAPPAISTNPSPTDSSDRWVYGLQEQLDVPAFIAEKKISIESENKKLFKKKQRFPDFFPPIETTGASTSQSTRSSRKNPPMLIDEKGFVSLVLNGKTIQVPSVIPCRRCDGFMRIFIKQNGAAEGRFYPNYRCSSLSTCRTVLSVKKLADAEADRVAYEKRIQEESEARERLGSPELPIRLEVTSEQLADAIANCFRENLDTFQVFTGNMTDHDDSLDDSYDKNEESLPVPGAESTSDGNH